LHEFKLGRRFIGRLRHGTDIISAVETACGKNSIRAASFSVFGAVRSFTIGTFDQTQLVYITHTGEETREIASCAGNVSIRAGNLFVHAHIVLSDEQGRTIGGRLFSETIIYSGEIELLELIGPSLERIYDEESGRFEFDL
jgi:predicted DNA-binding protein with PD1-like motif